MTEVLRTTYCVPQIGSKLASLACGTSFSVRAAAPCDNAGVGNPRVAASAPAPAKVFSTVLRSILVSLLRRRPRRGQSTYSLGKLPTPRYARAQRPVAATPHPSWPVHDFGARPKKT